MPEFRRTIAISHMPFSYEHGAVIEPFIMGVDDQAGDNISEHKAFSEARGHYWLWKNGRFEADEFVAINQYRRCFWFSQLVPPDHRLAGITRHLSVNVSQATVETTRADYVEYIKLISEADLAPLNHWLEGVDLVVNRNVWTNLPVHKLYGLNHRAQDWEIFANVLRKKGYDDGRFNWLTTHTVYIFTPELFNDYMTDWWDVMSEVYPKLIQEEDPYQHRKGGFLSEWFMSPWLIKQRIERPALRVQTLPVIEGLFQHDRQPGVM